MRRCLAAGCSVLVPLLSSAVWAGPKVAGSAPALGSWDLASGLALVDDGTGADETANDGIYSASVTLPAGQVQYKVAPNGINWDGALGTTNGDNLSFVAPSSGPVRFYYDTRDTTQLGWQPSQRSVSDSVTAGLAWIVVGNWQTFVGDTNWNSASSRTMPRDDGRGPDRVAGDGIYTLRVRATSDLPNGQFKAAVQGPSWTTKLGSDGWSRDPADSANGIFQAQAGDLITFEIDLKHGRLRAMVSPGTPSRLLLTEVVSAPSEAEYVEIYNPTSEPVDLSNYYLADTDVYWGIVKATPNSVSSSDFIVRFPVGAIIEPGQFQTVALAGGAEFRSAFGQNPTYQIPSSTPSTVPAMDRAFPNSLGSTRGLTNGSEPLVLFFWDGLSDRVIDVDYVYFGTPTSSNPVVNKTGLSADGPDEDTSPSSYRPDAPSTTAPMTANVTCRKDFGESGQISSGGNGVGGTDQTSEPLATTWRGGPTATPNAGTVNAMEITPAPAQLTIHGTQKFTARPYADTGKTAPMEAGSVLWATDPATPSTISFDSETQIATATAAGAGDQIVVREHGIEARSEVTVLYKAITASCAKTILANGQSTTCSAQALDVQDQPVSAVVFDWRVVSGSSVSIDPVTGAVTAHSTGMGTTVIRVRAQGDEVHEATVSIEVVTGLGTACSSAAECASGHCDDGVCCDMACGDGANPCLACSEARGASHDGVCTALQGNACDDGNACTLSDVCQSGFCVGGSEVVCEPVDECHKAGECNVESGQCTSPVAPDDTPCTGGLCQAGVCVPHGAAGAAGAGGTGAAGHAGGGPAGEAGSGHGGQAGAGQAGSDAGGGGEAGGGAGGDEAAPAVVHEPEKQSGCGCATAGSGASARLAYWAMVVVGAVGIRRRGRRR